MLIRPGFIALHGNRTEWLLAAVSNWISDHPLGPLESELIIVQNNGMGEWFRMGLASRMGICAATQFRLPARFQWWLYRQVLGRDQIPEHSPLDQDPIVWRLMRLLADLPETGADCADPLEPLRSFLRSGTDEPLRRHQLALRIADLFDQYQVHRPDWLDAWAAGEPVLIDARGQRADLPVEQHWQAWLWQRILSELPAGERTLTRSSLHRRVIDRLTAAASASAPAAASSMALPRRVVVFGITNLPGATLELLAALSQHSQVMLAIPNPCRFYWADIIDGRELLRAKRRRHPPRGQLDLRTVEFEAMHRHAHPLLAAWGRQARDFVRQLDEYDDLEATRARFELAKLELFSDSLPEHPTLLRQVQQHICDLLPLSEHDHRPIPSTDRSIVFHVAHGPVRELEILHDQLLLLLAQPPAAGEGALRPRDIVVMVPDIDAYAPAIRAVFGQYGKSDPRHIPFDIADLSARGSSPLVAAIDWLMGIASDRVRLPDLCALLSVPAVAARLDLSSESLEQLTCWMEGSGIRWGLDAAHRAALALEAVGDIHSLCFGLRRMLMGFAIGNPSDALNVPPPFAEVDAYGEVGGLEAGSVGALADLAEILRCWRKDSAIDADPVTWASRLRALVTALFKPVDDADRQTMAALEDALRHWLEQCALAGFEGRVPLAVAGQVWLDALERPSLGRRFRGGGVTFCTLTPMRAIPFEVVCLLGMNDGDFPRRSPSSDFDLIVHPGQRRPGDRARRYDDRQLMLEALLSARQLLYLSWCGRSARDNSEQPPSVLVAQLRDYLNQGWSESVVAERTTEHPLQAFSRRYFEGDPRLITLASEWRAAHDDGPKRALAWAPDLAPKRALAWAPDLAPERAHEVNPAVNLEPGRSGLRSPPVDAAVPLTIARLAHFLRNPVKAFFRHRLQVIFDEGLQALPDREVFKINALEHHGLIDELSGSLLQSFAARARSALREPDLRSLLDTMIARLERSGSLPMGGPGVRMREVLRQQVEPMVALWRGELEQHPFELERVALRFEHDGMVIEDWLDQRRASRTDSDSGLWLGLTASGLRQNAKGKPKARVDKLIEAWIRSLLAAASGLSDRGLLIGKDLKVSFAPVDGELARATLAYLLVCWRDGQMQPLPVAPRTALAFIEAKEDPDEKAAIAYEGDDFHAYGESEDPCLARCFPDYAALAACGRFPVLAERMYGPLNDWAKNLELTPLGADATTEDAS